MTKLERKLHRLTRKQTRLDRRLYWLKRTWLRERKRGGKG